MKYKRFGNTIVARIDRGEEILDKICELAESESIKLASVSALGATNDFTVGVFNTAEKKYYSNEFKGAFEIVSLTGTINTMDGQFYTHIHMSAGNDKGEVFGGHLNRAMGSAYLSISPSMTVTIISQVPTSDLTCLSSDAVPYLLPGSDQRRFVRPDGA